MSQSTRPTTDHSPIARAARCPVCLGAGELPSMTVAGLTNPCPRCVGVVAPARVSASVDTDPDDGLDRYGFPSDFIAGLASGAVIAAVAVGFLVRWLA